MIVLSAVIVAAAVLGAAMLIVSALRAAGGRSAGQERIATLLTLFAPALAATQQDPRAFLVWQPIANAARQLFPGDFAAIDAAMGGRFPFTSERIDAAHAQWTADWLGWEHAHDTEYKLKAAIAEGELVAQGGAPLARARLDAVEREKLESYQRRYAEYVRIAKALQALIGS
jgi:hypothetical protein